MARKRPVGRFCEHQATASASMSQPWTSSSGWARRKHRVTRPQPQLFVARDFYRTEVIVFGMIVIGVLWLLIDRLVLVPLERSTIERWGMVRRA